MKERRGKRKREGKREGAPRMVSQSLVGRRRRRRNESVETSPSPLSVSSSPGPRTLPNFKSISSRVDIDWSPARRARKRGKEAAHRGKSAASPRPMFLYFCTSGFLFRSMNSEHVSSAAVSRVPIASIQFHESLRVAAEPRSVDEKKKESVPARVRAGARGKKNRRGLKRYKRRNLASQGLEKRAKMNRGFFSLEIFFFVSSFDK